MQDIVDRINILLPEERLKILETVKRFCRCCGRVEKLNEYNLPTCEHCTPPEGS